MKVAFRRATARTYSPRVPKKNLRWNDLVAQRVSALYESLKDGPGETKQETIARELKVEQGTVSRLLSGEQQLTAHYLIEFGRIFGVEPGLLLPSLAEIESGKLQPREISQLRGAASDPGRNLHPLLSEYLKNHFFDTTPREQELLERANAVPREGEDPDAFYGAIIETLRRRSPK